MTTEPTIPTRQPAASPLDQFESERHNLALHALSTLARQFAVDPDFTRLIQVFLLTLSGQFSVGCSSIFLPDAQITDQKGFFASTDTLKCVQTVRSMLLDATVLAGAFPGYGARRLEQLTVTGETEQTLIDGLKDAGAAIVVPLITGDDIMGVVCLSSKVTRRPFTEGDLELLDTMIGTITPFIANSLLFHRISNLNAWYLDILNNVRQGVFVFDDQARLKKVNTTGLTLLRSFHKSEGSVEDYLGKAAAEVFPADICSGWAAHVKYGFSARSRKALSNSVVRLGEDDERIFSLRISGAGLQEGRAADLIVTVDDVTSQRASEQRLFDLQKFAEKGVMASSISHELNNFLGLVLGGVELSQLALKKQNFEKLAGNLDKLRDNVTKMERFTAGLTDFTKLNTTKQCADLNTVIQDVISFTSVQKRFRGIDIVTDLDPNLPNVQIDTDQIAQLLLNFMNNAADAIRQIEQPDGAIAIATRRDERSVSFSVTDNGIGIDPRIKDSLFRVHLTTKDKGHGYGLVTCARIIENHKARIQIDSTPGAGATFAVTLPLDDIDSPPPE